MKFPCSLIATAAAVVLPAQGALFLDVGTFDLSADTPGQSIELFLSNTSDSAVSIGDFNLILQVADGGPSGGGFELGPAITSVNLVNSTVYSGFSPSVLADPENTPQLQLFYLTLPSSLATAPEVAGNGRVRVASLTLDTTGVPQGQYGFSVVGTTYGDSEMFDPFDAPLRGFSGVNGFLNLGPQGAIPEPRAWATLALVGLGVFACLRRGSRTGFL